MLPLYDEPSPITVTATLDAEHALWVVFAPSRYSGPAWLRDRISLVRDSDTRIIRVYGTAAEGGR